MKEIINENGEIIPIVTKGKSSSILKKIRESLEAKTFIEMVLKDDEALRLLCIHRSALSPFDKFNYPLVFSFKRKKAKSTLPFGLVAIKEGAKAQHTIEHVVERTKPKLENLVDKFMRKYGLLLQDLDAKSESIIFQEEREQQIIGMIISQIAIQELGDEEKILKIIKIFEDFVIDDVIPIGQMIIESLKKDFFDFGVISRDKIINSSGLSEREYENVIGRLEKEYSVIKPLLSVFWCENENHEHYSFFVFNHSKVPEIKCPICGKKLSVGTFYYFIPDINYILRSREGLIQSLVMYMLDKTNQEWLPSVYLKEVKKDTEKDIVVKKRDNSYIIIEIKNFATDVNLRTKRENFKKLLNQALKHLDTYLNQNIYIDSIYLITNYWTTKETNEIIDSLLSQKKFTKLNNVELEVFGPNNLHELGKLLEER